MFEETASETFQNGNSLLWVVTTKIKDNVFTYCKLCMTFPNFPDSHNGFTMPSIV